MRTYPATCKECGAQVNYPSVRCKKCGTRIPCPMGFLSTLLAVLWFAQLPVMFFIAYKWTSPEYRVYVALILLLNVVPITILLLLDRRKANAEKSIDSNGDH